LKTFAIVNFLLNNGGGYCLLKVKILQNDLVMAAAAACGTN